MKNKEAIKSRIEDIKNNSDALEGVSRLADIVFETNVSSCEERKEIRENVKELEQILKGNGSPSGSIIARMDRLEEMMKFTREELQSIRVMLIGDVTVGDTPMSVNHRLDDVNHKLSEYDKRIKELDKKFSEKFDNINKFLWIALATIVGTALSNLLPLVF
jgi:DNA repair exonuclease SbcCD ATPase subunit